MLLNGIHHVATLTNDADRLVSFYRDMFDAEVISDDTEFPDGTGPRVTIIRIGDATELNVFSIDGNTEPDRQVPMFGRGRLDHFGLMARSLDDFETVRDRLMAAGAADDFVTDFGQVLSVFFRDPDGLEGEVLVPNPDAQPGASNPPGTRSTRYA